MSDQNTRKEKLKIIFATYPQQETVYMTSDDKAFFNEEQASAHAQRLADQTVSKYPKKFWEVAIDVLDKNQEKRETEETEGEGTEGEGTEGEEETETVEDVETVTEEVSTEVDERAALAARFEELAGRKPAANIKLENLRKAVDELEQANN